MRTLHRYILSSFLTTFLLAMLVLTFVMTIGLVFSSMKFIARGMPAGVFLMSIVQSLPGTLSYSVPIAALVSSLLVFSRLSSDSEISAMRSCGVPLVAIMRTPVLLAVLLSLVCLYINDNVSPDSNYARSFRRKAFRTKDLTALIEPGTWAEVGDYDIFVARRSGENLDDLRVNQPMKNGGVREITAAHAVIRSETDEEGNPVSFLDMRTVTIDPFNEDQPGAMRADTWKLPLSALTRKEGEPDPKEDKAPPRHRIKDMRSWELMRDILVARTIPPRTAPEKRAISRAKAEIASRLSLAMACFCFVIVGIPLGIQNHRRQSSIGLALAGSVAGAFYLFCILGESLAKNPTFNAHWIIFTPVLICLVLAAIATKKQN